MTDEQPTRTPAERTRAALELVGLVVAPTTAVTSILLYFGWVRENAVYGYFGVDQSLLDFSVQDYLLRSVGAVFRPLATILGCLAVLVLAARLAGLVGPRVARWTVARVPVLPVVQVVVAAALVEEAVAALAGGRDPLWGAVALASGAVVASPFLTGGDRRFWGRVLVGSTVGFAVFWATAVYAQRDGSSLATYIDHHPTGQAALTVYSATRLHFTSRSVTEQAFPADGDKPHYAYSGLRLLSHVNGRWVILAGRPSDAGRDTVVVLPDSALAAVEINNG